MRPLLFCYGTRPQAIKASRLVPALQRLGPLLTADTGQHYDYELSRLLYEQLGLVEPDRVLGVGSGPLPAQTAAILLGVDALLTEHQPRAVVVIGDTVSTLGAALAAAERRIPVVHVEAGLRSDDPYMAEEISRRTVDHLSALCCAPSAAAADRLVRESVRGVVTTTGDVAFDVLVHARAAAAAAIVERQWPVDPDQPFAFATLHRAELVDDPVRLAGALRGLSGSPLPVLLALHPRTAKSIERHELGHLLVEPVRPVGPVGYLEAIGLVARAAVVVTDSGGIQREAYWLHCPCVTMRAETEWGETVAEGANRLAPPGEQGYPTAAAIRAAIADPGTWEGLAYGDGTAAERVVDAIASVLPD